MQQMRFGIENAKEPEMDQEYIADCSVTEEFRDWKCKGTGSGSEIHSRLFCNGNFSGLKNGKKIRK